MEARQSESELKLKLSRVELIIMQLVGIYTQTQAKYNVIA